MKKTLHLKFSPKQTTAMVSFRFPFSFSQPSARPPKRSSISSSRSFSATTIACSAAFAVAAGAAAIAISKNSTNPFLQNALDTFISNNYSHSSPVWSSLSLTDGQSAVTESKTGHSFPSIVKDTQRLLGIGLRKKSLIGLKNIDVYAFGVYADDNDVKKFLREKYETLSVSELKDKKDVIEDLIENDISITVRLQIVYGKLSIRSVRNAFEGSVGSRLKKFGGSDNKELLQKFTSQFSDGYKIPRGSIIDLSRQPGHVLRTTIDGKDVGSIESKLLCRAVLDLYVGDDPFDQKAKEDVELNLATLIKQ